MLDNLCTTKVFSTKPVFKKEKKTFTDIHIKLHFFDILGKNL